MSDPRKPYLLAEAEPEKIERLLRYLDDDAMTDAELEALGAELRGDESARMTLALLAIQSRATTQIHAAQSGVSVETITPPLRRSRSAWYAAAAMIALAVTVWFMLPSTPDSLNPEPAAALGAVAMITNLENATFDASSPAMTLGGELVPGPIALSAGRAQIMFNSTAVVDLIGPCEFEMTGPNRGRLTAGRIVVFVLERATGFTVDGPRGLSVVDLGTRFIMTVDPAGAVEVAVLQGHVELRHPTGVLAQLDPGQVRRVLETGVLASSGRLDDLERRARTAVFRAGFDYAAVEPSVGADAANLNGGMIDRIGTFAGPLPAAGDTADDPAELITFDDGPAGGRVMKLDRAVADGALTAQLAEPVHLHGATVGFDIATRRTGGVDDRRKDFDIVGFDAANREAFHLRVNTAPNLARLAAVVEGAVEISKLTDTFGGVGADSAGDLPFTPADPTQSGALGTVTLSMTPAGYSIHFVRGHQTYATGLIQYNGAARTLSRIEFQFRGSDDVNAQSGFFLDNLSVDGIPVDGP